MTFYSVLERNELSSHDKTQRNFKYILLSEINPIWDNYILYDSNCMTLSKRQTYGDSKIHSCWGSSVQFSCSVMSDSVRPHGLQQTRLPSPSRSPRAYPNSCPRSQRCHPTISSSVVPFSSCLQSFPASGSFLMSQFFTSKWTKYWSFSFSISPSNEDSGLISFIIHWFDLLAVPGSVYIIAFLG